MEKQKRPSKQELQSLFSIVRNQWNVALQRLHVEQLPIWIRQIDRYDPNRKYDPGTLRPDQSPDDVTISAEEFKPVLRILAGNPGIVPYLVWQLKGHLEDTVVFENFIDGCDNPDVWFKKWENANPIAYANARSEAMVCLMVVEEHLKKKGEAPKTLFEIQAEKGAEESHATAHDLMRLLYILSSPNPVETEKRLRDILEYPLSEYRKRHRTNNDSGVDKLEVIMNDLKMKKTKFFDKEQEPWRQSFIFENLDSGPKYIYDRRTYKRIKKECEKKGGHGA